MVTGAVNLMESERGVACIIALIAVTILAVLKVVTGAQWLTFAQVIISVLVASKTITGALEIHKSKPAGDTTATEPNV